MQFSQLRNMAVVGDRGDLALPNYT